MPGQRSRSVNGHRPRRHPPTPQRALRARRPALQATQCLPGRQLPRRRDPQAHPSRPARPRRPVPPGPRRPRTSTNLSSSDTAKRPPSSPRTGSPSSGWCSRPTDYPLSPPSTGSSHPPTSLSSTETATAPSGTHPGDPPQPPPPTRRRRWAGPPPPPAAIILTSTLEAPRTRHVNTGPMSLAEKWSLHAGGRRRTTLGRTTLGRTMGPQARRPGLLCRHGVG